MKVVVLATNSNSTWMMVNALRTRYPELHVVLEEPVSRWLLLKRRATRIGLLRVFGQALFMLYLPILRCLSNKYSQSLIAGAGYDNKRPPNLIIENFESVNSKACITWLASVNPDVVVLNGTRIVSSAVLSACSALFLNTHCGITPAYRGVHGGYWALYKNDFKNAGVTVHVVDTGIDTGDIVFQGAIEIDKLDNFTTYPIKQYIVGIPLMLRALEDVSSGHLHTGCREDLTSGLWLHPTVWQYFSARWLRGVR